MSNAGKRSQYGHRLELVLRRFGYPRFQPSYVDASVLEADIMHSRRLAQRAIQRKLRTRRFQSMLLKNNEAARLCGEAQELNVETDVGFHRFVDYMEKVVRLLSLPLTV